jgi:hypothetical protein
MLEFYTRLPIVPLREARPPRRPVAFLSILYDRSIPPIPAKPLFFTVRWDIDAQFHSLHYHKLSQTLRELYNQAFCPIPQGLAQVFILGFPGS